MKVMIGIPSTEIVHADFAMALASLAAYTVFKDPSIQMSIFNAKGCSVERNRTYIVEHALKIGADKLFFLDTDMVFAPDILMGLIESEAWVIGCDAVRRVRPYDTLAISLKGIPFQGDETGIHEVLRMGTGVMLIDLRAFNKLRWPWFANEMHADGQFDTEDYLLCDDIRQAGINIYCDLDLSRSVGHIGNVTAFWPGVDNSGRRLVD